MKNILQIMDFAAPYRGNFISSIECLEKHWTGKGSMVYLFPNNAEKLPWVQQLISNGKKVYFIDASFFSRKVSWSNIKRLKYIIKTENIEVIHTHFVAYNYSLFLLKKILLRKVKFIAQFHSQYKFTKATRLKKIKIFVINSTFDLILGVSKSVSDGIVRIGVENKRVNYILNGIDFERLQTFENIDLSNSKESHNILMFGWPYKIKGIDIAIRSISKLIQIGHQVSLTISYCGNFKEIEEQIVTDFGEVPKWVTILSSREDVATFYNSSDIFLSASREEGFSYALVEASFSKPYIISSDIPAPSSLGIPQMCFFKTEDVDDLVAKLKDVFSLDSDQKNEIKKAQQAYVVRKFDLDSWAKKLITYY